LSFYLLDSADKVSGARLGQGTEVLDELLAGHAHTSVGDDDVLFLGGLEFGLAAREAVTLYLLVLVGLDLDLEVAAVGEGALVGECDKADLRQWVSFPESS